MTDQFFWWKLEDMTLTVTVDLGKAGFSSVYDCRVREAIPTDDDGPKDLFMSIGVDGNHRTDEAWRIDRLVRSVLPETVVREGEE